MGSARLLSRTPLLLAEMDDALRRAERGSAGSGSPEDIRRHFTAHVRSGREPREFFANELEDYHKAHDETRAADQEHLNATNGSVRRRNDERRLAAWEGMERTGKTLAAKAHATDHPVGQYLDWGHDKARVRTADLHTALLHVSHDPKVKPPIGYAPGIDHRTNERHFRTANEASARHLEHGLKAHGLGTGLKRSQRDPNMVITGGR
jgi:hypothetical protein